MATTFTLVSWLTEVALICLIDSGWPITTVVVSSKFTDCKIRPCNKKSKASWFHRSGRFISVTVGCDELVITDTRGLPQERDIITIPSFSHVVSLLFQFGI